MVKKVHVFHVIPAIHWNASLHLQKGEERIKGHMTLLNGSSDKGHM